MARLPQLSKRKWNRTTAAHLACRAGFGPSPAEWNRLSGLTPEEAVDSLISPAPQSTPPSTPDWYQEETALWRTPQGKLYRELKELTEPEKRKIRQEFNKQNGQRMSETRIWWLDRMVSETNPFEEKLSLFWHGHFATAYQKVRNPTPMLGQNLMFREKGHGHLGDLLEALSSDPAMLFYLDNFRSNKRKPNENYARELMELFSLGEGNYTEDDVLNAARAFSGWTLEQTRWVYKFEPSRHDTGHKRFMGDSGRFNGRDIIDRIVAKPQASIYLAERLWTFYASDRPNENAISDVAKALQEADHDIDAGLRALFLHEDFYHPSVIRGKIKSPVDLTVGLTRAIHCTLPLGKKMDAACRSLGQQLFDPPSVKGWDGGSAWITASNLAMRYNYAEQLIRMKNSFSNSAILPDPTVTREEARDLLLERLYFSKLRDQDRQAVDQLLEGMPPPSDWKHTHYVKILNHLVQQPQFQLC